MALFTLNESLFQGRFATVATFAKSDPPPGATGCAFFPLL